MEFGIALKDKITTIVENYVKNNSPEFNSFKIQQQAYRDNLRTQWAELKGTDVMVRELNRYPETLFALLKMKLSDLEYLEFQETETQIWFGDTFRDFKVADKKG